MKTSVLSFALLILMLVGCSHKTAGISTSSVSQKDNILEVLSLTYEEAIQTAVIVSKKVFNDGTKVNDQSQIISKNRSLLMGDIEVIITPRLYKSNITNKVGVLYEVESNGIGINGSLLPSYGSTDFFDGLKSYISAENIKIIKLENAKPITQNKLD